MEQKLTGDKDISAVLIAGPTASGKSALALELARDLGGEIVNADSMQVLQCARPVDRAGRAPGISKRCRTISTGHVSPVSAYSTGIWLDQATEAIAAIRARGALPVVVGGTGLYFRALTGGLSDMPAIPEPIRTELRARLEAEGVAPLHQELARLDPDMAARLRPADRQRNSARARGGSRHRQVDCRVSGPPRCADRRSADGSLPGA